MDFPPEELYMNMAWINTYFNRVVARIGKVRSINIDANYEIKYGNPTSNSGGKNIFSPFRS